MRLRLASVQEQVRIPLELVIVIVIVQVGIAAGLKGDSLLVPDCSRHRRAVRGLPGLGC